MAEILGSVDKKNNDYNNREQTDPAAGIIAPSPAMRPGRECTEEHHYQKHQQNKSQHNKPFVFRTCIGHAGLSLQRSRVSTVETTVVFTTNLAKRLFGGQGV